MSNFVPNPNVEAEIRAEPALNDALQAIAEAGLEVAQRLVPVDTGELRDSLHVEDGENGGKRIVAGTDHWPYVEFGTSEMEAQPYLRPVIDEIGLAH